LWNREKKGTRHIRLQEGGRGLRKRSKKNGLGRGSKGHSVDTEEKEGERCKGKNAVYRTSRAVRRGNGHKRFLKHG